MTARSNSDLKNLFANGDTPTGTDFGDLIDTIPGALGAIADGDIPGTIARDSEVTAAVGAHDASATAHVGTAHVWTAGQTFVPAPQIGQNPIGADRSLMDFATNDAAIKFRVYSSSFLSFTHQDDVMGLIFDQDAPYNKPTWGMQFEHDYFTDASNHQAEWYLLWQMGAQQRRPIGVAIPNNGTGNPTIVDITGTFRVLDYNGNEVISSQPLNIPLRIHQYSGNAIQLIYDGTVSRAINMTWIGTKGDLQLTYNTTTQHLRIDNTGKMIIGTGAPTSMLQVVGLPTYANNAAAVAGGLTAGAFYRTGADPDPVCVVH